MAERRNRGGAVRRGSGGRRPSIELLERRYALAAQPIINEILASNDGVVQDVDGDFSDYIELYNAGDAAINLAGWHLTDDAQQPMKWQFPSVNLGAGQYLVVFASGKDRAVAGSQLHANFALAASGEYVGLTRPDGTVASQISPTFPAQYENVSYGLAGQVAETTLVGSGAAGVTLVPSNGLLGTAWTQASFVPDASWQSGQLGVGYSDYVGPPPSTTVLQVDFNDRDNTGNTQAGFSSFVLGGGGIQALPVTRSFGGVDVTVVDASGFGFDDRTRTTPLNGGAFTESALLQDFIFSQDLTGTGGLDVRIDGLAPGEIYTLTVWSYDSGSTSLRISDWTANGVTVEDYGFSGSSTPTSNDLFRFRMVVAANAQGEILLEGRRDANNTSFAVFLNALRLETGDTVTTPPAGQSLQIDFNDRTEGESGAANTESGYAVMTLDENGASFNGATVTFSAFGGAILDDRDRILPAANGAFTLEQVYDDFIFTSGVQGSGMEILLQGLAPNAQYDVVLRSLDGTSSGTRQATWTEVSGPQPVVIAAPYSYNAGTQPTSNDANAMRARLTTSPQGTLVLRGVQGGGNTSVVVNGLELSRATFDEFIATDVEASMLGVNSSAYIRVPFAVPDLSVVDQLLMDVRYDAGFVAYLNGQEVARRNSPTGPGVAPAYNAAATIERSNSEAVVAETIDLSAFRHLLSQGSGNVLAFHGLNSAAGDADFLIAPQLRALEAVGSAFRYFETPTPGAENGDGVIDFVADVSMSAGHGFYDSPFALSLSTATAGASIYYTFDGSVPGPGNAASVLYSAPIVVSGSTVVRATALKDGFADSNVATATYIFIEDVLGQSIDTSSPANNPFGLAYPAIWQANAPADFNMDPRVVDQWDDNDPANQDLGIREGLKGIRTMSIVMDHDDLWHPSSGIYPQATNQGGSWRRPGSVELIDPISGGQFQHNVGVQMHGAASRDNVRTKKHSFRLVFNNEFDGPGKLNYPLFDNSNFSDINTVILKAAFTDSFPTRTATGRYSPLDSTYTRDVWMLDAQRAMGSWAPDATYVHLYINGLYWGVYYATERADDASLASHLGGAEEDWDVIKDFNELFRGSKIAWNQMFALADQLPGASATAANAIYQQLQGRNPDGTVNPSLPVYLDMDNLIDYMILHIYGGVEDWPSHNWVAARNRVDPGKGFQFITWDQEISFDGRFRDRTEANNAFTPAELYYNLRNSSEFKLRFADRVQTHLFNGGALTVEAAQARWQQRADQIEAAIIAESARWGDAREGEVVNVPPTTVVPLMTVEHWRDSVADVRDGYIPQSHSLTISRLQNDGLLPSVGAPAFSQLGGAVLPGFQLSMSGAGGTIYYTTNGQDPRLLGGAVNFAAATAYNAPVTINETTVVKARRLFNGTWSPLSEATFAVLQGTGGIVISEINYHPHDVTAEEAAAIPGVQEDDFEFIEIVNTHPTESINLLNMSLAGGLTFTFGSANLAPGEYGLIVENEEAFEARYGTGHNILGSWSGGASNSGETIELRDALGGVIMAVDYWEADPWSEAADGDGASLELIDPWETPAERLGKWYSWRASTEFGGSPGEAGVGPLGVVINEVRSRATTQHSDAIELHNPTDQPINIGGWYLSDSGGSPLKFRIPDGVVLGRGEYVVFDEDDFNPTLPLPGQTPFAINGNEGDDVFLVVPDGLGGVSQFVDSVHFGASFEGETAGRLPNGSGRLAPMSPTLGAANSAARLGPLLITEVAYRPGAPSQAALAIDPQLVESHLEFIEVYNRTASAVDLTDYRLAGDATFDFAAGASLAAGKTLVLVSFDPAAPGNANRVAAFRAHYGIDGSVALVGPFSGGLANDGARLELQAPDEPPASMPDFVPRVTSDEVLYDDLAPWPIVPGTGVSIHRSVNSYGNASASWQAAAPSPGTAPVSSGPSADFDGDGDVDGADFLAWQRGYGATGASRSQGDADGDADVDAGDLNIWRSTFGAGSSAAATTAAEQIVSTAALLADAEGETSTAAGLGWASTWYSLPQSFVSSHANSTAADSPSDSRASRPRYAPARHEPSAWQSPFEGTLAEGEARWRSFASSSYAMAEIHVDESDLDDEALAPAIDEAFAEWR